MDKSVLLDVADGVATVTLNRAEGANALDMKMGRELLEAALSCEADPGVRAVVVTGAGKHFCFGGDLRGMADKGDTVGGYLNELTTHIHSAISAFTRMRAPVIAAVNGTAAGGGVGLVCMADLAIAGRGSKFSLAYTGVGLAPDCSTSFLLPRIVGRRRALELLLTNRTLYGRRGAGLGSREPGGRGRRGADAGPRAGGPVCSGADGFLCRREAAHGGCRPGARGPDGARGQGHRGPGDALERCRGRPRFPREA